MDILIILFIRDGGKSKSLEENLRISLVTDTYEQILDQYTKSKKHNQDKFDKTA